MRSLTHLVISLSISLSCVSPALAQRMTPIDGIVDFGDMVLPAGIGTGAGIMLHQHLNSHPMPASGDVWQPKLNQIETTQEECLRLIRENGKGGRIQPIGEPNTKNPGLNRVICTIGKDL